jgi:8-oxo-dGTP diphosphatase
VIDFRSIPEYSFSPQNQQFQASAKTETYEKPLVTVDVVLFTMTKGEMRVLLLKRASEPFKEMWSIPGGFINLGETLEEAASRWLEQRTGVSDIYFEQLGAFGTPDRDPRARVITVSYFAVVNFDKIQTPEALKHDDTAWITLEDLPALAFDHGDIIENALLRLREKLQTSPIAFQLLPEKFTLTQLQKVYELILKKEIDKRNFRKKALASGILFELAGETKMDGFHRPAQLYAFNKVKVPPATLGELTS